MSDIIEQKMIEYERRGELQKAKWLSTIEQRILPSFKARIAKDDKSVLNELILPKWLDWELLREWAKSD